MGLFSGKKITYVSSVAYNMAGDADGRINYIKTLVINNVTSNTDASIADTINSGMLNGPQMNFRKFYRWANINFTTVGMPNAVVNGYADLDTTIIQGQLPVHTGQTAYVLSADRINADYTAWAEQYILIHHSDLYDTNWASFFQADGTILIQYEDGSSETFTPTNFDQSASYIYILYAYYIENSVQPLVTGSTITLGSSDSWPSLSGWTLVSDTITPTNQNLNKIVTAHKVYIDGSPDTTTVTTTTSVQSWNDREAHYTKTDPATQDLTTDETKLYVRFNEMYFHSSVHITQTTTVTTSTDAFGTTTTTTVQDVLNLVRTYRIDHTDTIVSQYVDTTLWLYKINSGNAVLDGLINNPITMAGEFYPPIPVRLNNDFVSSTSSPTLYVQCVSGYKKLTGKKFDDLVTSIADNDSLSDIDYAFVVEGVSLNVVDNACKKYLYKFFEKLSGTQAYSKPQWDQYQTDVTAYYAAIAAYQASLAGGVAVPSVPRLPSLGGNTITITPNGTIAVNYDIRLNWTYIEAKTLPGLGKVDATKGDLWFVKLPDVTYNQYVVSGQGHNSSGSTISVGTAITVTHIALYWQTDTNEFSYLDIFGLEHENFVYNGKAVIISAIEALDDTEESGFIVPMHYETMKELSLAVSNQMATASCFVVFNCYQVVKQKWYETGIFQIILVVVIAIVSAVFTGGAGIGLLGTSLAVGTSLGFTGLTAIIVGAIANALAAVVVANIIETASIKIFGAQFGEIIGAILTFVVMNAAISFQTTGSFGLNWGDMMKADNLMKLTDVASKGYSAYMNSVNQGIAQDTQQLISTYNSKQKDIEAKYASVIGYTNIGFDPSWMTNSASGSIESSSTFLTRTLMVGTDIAQMSQDMVSQFADLNLALPKYNV